MLNILAVVSRPLINILGVSLPLGLVPVLVTASFEFLG